MTTTSLGTPLTMAPEILDNKAYTANVDLWSIGCVVFRLLYGCDPFMAGSKFELRKIIEKDNGKNLKFPKTPLVSESVNLFFLNIFEDSFFSI